MDRANIKPTPKHEEPNPILHVKVRNITANYLLDRPLEELIPHKFLTKADESHVLRQTPWLFKRAERGQDARLVDLDQWSTLDIRFRGVFKTLKKVPDFDKGLYECGSDIDFGKLEGSGNAQAQGQVVYALLTELVDMLGIKRQICDERGNALWAGLRPRLLNCLMEYRTSYHQRLKDTPLTAGFLSLHFTPNISSDHHIIPVSASTTLTSKTKLLLAQLHHHIRSLKPQPPADNLPDQEVFLIGLHGSRLHIFRAVFPGRKTSLLWCGRYVGKGRGLEERMGSLQIRNGADGDLFSLDGQDGGEKEDEYTFHVLATEEHDLWTASGFHSASRALITLILYVLSGEAHCAPLQAAFKHSPTQTSEPKPTTTTTMHQRGRKPLKNALSEHRRAFDEARGRKKEKRREKRRRVRVREQRWAPWLVWYGRDERGEGGLGVER